MKLARAEILSGGGVLENPVSNAQKAWPARRGFVVRLHDAAGRIGQGEASPLPAHGADDLAAARGALDACVARVPGLDLERPLESIGGAVTASPAARFALETAALDLLGQERDRPLWALLAPSRSAAPAPLALSALIDMSDLEAARRSAERALERGVATLKLKIGRPGAWEAELRIAEGLRAALGSRPRLRFDVNRAWSPGEALARLHALSAFEPEFVEEPVDGSELAALGQSPVPLALDESLLRPGLLDEQGRELVQAGVVAVVLKPMLLGGFGRCLALAARARSLGMRVVVTHLFDGPLALTAAAALALATMTDDDGAAGLDRHGGLSAWPELDLPALSGSHVVPWTGAGLGLPLLAGEL